MGSLNVWPSYTLKLYTANNTTLITRPMSELETSLVGSLPSLGAMFGTAITGLIIDNYGRKRGVMLLTLPFLVSLWHQINHLQKNRARMVFHILR